MSIPYDKYPEMYSWMRENMKGHFICCENTCYTMLFEFEEDAFAFKLRWS